MTDLSLMMRHVVKDYFEIISFCLFCGCYFFHLITPINDGKSLALKERMWASETDFFYPKVRCTEQKFKLKGFLFKIKS